MSEKPNTPQDTYADVYATSSPADGDVNAVKSKLKNGEITVQEYVERQGEDSGYGRTMSQ